MYRIYSRPAFEKDTIVGIVVRSDVACRAWRGSFMALLHLCILCVRFGFLSASMRDIGG